MDLIEISEAEEILSKYSLTLGSEILPLNLVVNRVLKEDIYATLDVPLYDNSAMDGYGVRFCDAGKKVKVVGSVFAGSSDSFTFSSGECVKIMTGARVSGNIEAVVPFENVSLDGEFVVLPKDIKENANIRPCAGELSSGELIATSGSTITPSLIGLMATFGITFVKVQKLPKIGILSSGDELVEPWSVAKEVSIHNSNSFTIYSLLQSYGYSSTYIGVIDDKNRKEILASYIDSYDILITSGGVSKGEADYIKDILASNGAKTLLSGVNLKPGKPITISKCKECYIFSLPGNPMAAYTTALLFLLPFIGATKRVVKAENDEDFAIGSKRTNVVFGVYSKGKFKSYNKNKYSSNMLSPIYKSNGYVIAKNNAVKGDILEVVLYV